MIGCAHVSMSQESVDEVKSIDIDPAITIPRTPNVDGTVDVGSNLIQGLLLGYSPLPPQAGGRFRSYMNTNNIKLDEIVLRAFRRNVELQGYFELRDDADATLELMVLTYGFKMPAFDVTKNQRRPELVLEATLRSKDSTILWTKRVLLMRNSVSTHAHPIWALWKNPRLVERSFEQASCIVAYRLLSDLHPSRPATERSAEEVPNGPICDPVVHVENRIECTPGVGCVHHKRESWDFAPSRIPVQSNCESNADCSFQ